mgnify:CR=1 FL=1
MIKIEYRGIKEIHDKYSAIITSLRQQFAKFEKEREKRENKISEEAIDPINEDLPISNHIRNFLEWDTNALLLEEQTIQTYENYIKGLLQYLKEVKNQGERITELTEELERKEEDLELMADLIKKKESEANEEKQRLMEIIRRLRNKQLAQSDENEMVEVDEERESLIDEIMEKPKKKVISGKRVCEKCGKDISHRRTDTRYCIECRYLKKRELDRKRAKKIREYDKRGDEINENPEEDNTELPKEGNDDEPTLEEGEEYEEAGIIKNNEDEDNIENGEESEE